MVANSTPKSDALRLSQSAAPIVASRRSVGQRPPLSHKGAVESVRVIHSNKLSNAY